MEKTIQIDFRNYDFVDFGCSKGGSIKEAIRTFGYRKGLGIDINPEKVELTKTAGFDALVADATEVGSIARKAVRFVTMMHFLEHLPSLGIAKKCLLSSICLATHFVNIRLPYFDADGYLFLRQLKLYWSNWRGHHNHMTCLQFHNVLIDSLRNKSIKRFKIYGIDRISNSLNAAVHHLLSPIDQHEFDPAVHPAKDRVDFDFPVYRETMVLISMSDDELFRTEESRFGNRAELLYDSGQTN